MQKHVKFITGNQYVDLFIEHCRNINDIDEIIKGISAANTKLLKEIDDNIFELNEGVKNQIMNAYHYINSFVNSNEKYQNILDWFKEVPLLFRIALEIKEKELYEII